MRKIIKDCTLYCGDCFEVLPTLSVMFNAVITDPPFGLTNCKWDTKFDLEKFWNVAKTRVLDNAVFTIFSCGKFVYQLFNSNPSEHYYDLIWKKRRAVGFLDAKIKPLRNYEHISIFAQRQKKKNSLQSAVLAR
jgi:site-specific DNA-methyltransferase (adenine-specific)